MTRAHVVALIASNLLGKEIYDTTTHRSEGIATLPAALGAAEQLLQLAEAPPSSA